MRISELKVSGVRDSGVREIKRKNSNLNTETLVIGISDCGLRTSIFNLHSETGNPPEGWESEGQIYNQKNPASVAGERVFFTAEL